ncbi:MAG: cupin domain-containing protein [Chloroflexota bacterium]
MPYVPDADAVARPDADLRALAARNGPGPWRVALAGDAGARAVLLGWPPGFVTIPHVHPGASEIFLVQAGRLGFRLDDRPEVELGPGSFLVARPRELHGLRVLGGSPAVLLAIVGPNEDRPDEMIEDPAAWPGWGSAAR